MAKMDDSSGTPSDLLKQYGSTFFRPLQEWLRHVHSVITEAFRSRLFMGLRTSFPAGEIKSLPIIR